MTEQIEPKNPGNRQGKGMTGYGKLKSTTCYIPQGLLSEMMNLVKSGYYMNQSEAIRVAIRDLVIKEKGRANQ